MADVSKLNDQLDVSVKAAHKELVPLHDMKNFHRSTSDTHHGHVPLLELSHDETTQKREGSSPETASRTNTGTVATPDAQFQLDPDFR
jgi:hypothetical protein